MNEWYGFTADSARRIGDVVRKVERTPVPINRRPAKGEVFLPTDPDIARGTNISGIRIPKYGVAWLSLLDANPASEPYTMVADRAPYAGTSRLGIAVEGLNDDESGFFWIRGRHPFHANSSGGNYLGSRFDAVPYGYGTIYDFTAQRPQRLGPILCLGRTSEVQEGGGFYYLWGDLNGRRGDYVYIAQETNGDTTFSGAWNTVLWKGMTFCYFRWYTPAHLSSYSDGTVYIGFTPSPLSEPDDGGTKYVPVPTHLAVHYSADYAYGVAIVVRRYAFGANFDVLTSYVRGSPHSECIRLGASLTCDDMSDHVLKITGTN